VFGPFQSCAPGTGKALKTSDQPSGSQLPFRGFRQWLQGRAQVNHAAALQTLAEVAIEVAVLDHITSAPGARLEEKPGIVVHNPAILYLFEFA
jgi:hypothetical protein